MTGGAFVHHPESCDVTMSSTGEQFASLRLEPFTVFDEHYFVGTDEGLDLFLESRSVNGVQPAGWTKTFGKGRVFVLTPGHFEGVWSHPSFQELLRKGFEWVTHG
jgi:type 1 glutamine amidotransferase